MGIEPDDIAQVRSATDIVAIIGEHTEVKRVGRQWMARCPMHGERTPSLSVSAEKGVYYCFGCRRSGDAITFVREIDGLGFVDAVERLASRAGISLRYTRPDEASTHKRRRRLLEAVTRARDFYHERLLKADDAGPARAYLRSRGYDGDVVRRYRVGWAPDGWDLLARHLKLTSPDLRSSGLGLTNWGDGSSRGGADGRGSDRDSRQRDFFRSRVMFPISDERGDPVAFGGRVLPDAKGKGPKYMNTSSAAVIYEKSRVLYGLNEHRVEIVRQGQAVICEGYTDVIGAAVAGVDTAVATCGTALTEQHVQLLKRFSADRLVLAFDADTAGKVAAERVYEWERKHELEVFVAALPDGSDPDDLARTDPEALRYAVSSAMPFLQFRVDRVLAEHHLDTLEDRGRAAAAAAEVVGEHPDGMVRDNYLMSIADRCRVEIQLLRKAEESVRNRRRGSRDSHRSATPRTMRSEAPTGRGCDPISSRRPASGYPDRGDSPWQDLKSGRSWQSAAVEDEALRLLIHYPQEASAWLHRSLFADSTRREAFDALREANSVIGAGEMVSEPVAGLIHRLAVDPGDIPAVDVLARIAGLAAPRAMAELRRRAADSSDATLRQEYIHCFTWLNEQVELLTESDTRDTTLSVLIPWLIEHGRRSEAAGRSADTKRRIENAHTADAEEDRDADTADAVTTPDPGDESSAVISSGEIALGR